MERGEVYLTAPNPPDPRLRRPFVVVSRAELIRSRYSSVICVPVYRSGTGVATEVELDERCGLKTTSFARCDELTSVAKERLTAFIGRLPAAKLVELDRALAAALEINPAHLR